MTKISDLAVRRYSEPQNVVWRGRYVHNWFSNFDLVGFPVEYRGHRTRCLETAYVAAKNPDAMVVWPPNASNPTLVAYIDIIFGTKTPGEAKRLGSPKYRGGLLDPQFDWDNMCLAAMDFLLRQRWQPGTKDAERLAGMQGPIVEWNNWNDTRFGASLKTLSGRNGLGLLLDVISEEIRVGHVNSGAEEPFWKERQGELVEKLNKMWPETIEIQETKEDDLHSEKAGRPLQMSLF